MPTLILPHVLAALAVAQPGAFKSPVPYPHPLITEVLYAVPTGPEGDANGDGTRHPNGDEFIELINPHDRPIQLRGYTITDRNPAAAAGQGPDSAAPRGSGFRFVFPDLTLQPGQVVVLFNGHESVWKGPVGDSDKPAPPNDKFHGALVFSMRIDSPRVGLSNTHDYVLLSAPDGKPLHAIVWGEPADAADKPPAETALVEKAPDTFGQSVERTPDNRLVPHPHQDGRTYSPGKPPLARPR